MDARKKIEAEWQRKLNEITEMKHQLSEIENRLMDSDVGIVRAAKEDWGRLLDQFYEVNQIMMAPEQYESAKQDITYFRTLIDLAIVTYQPEDHDMGTLH